MSVIDGRVVSATGVLARFNEAGLLEAPDIHTAQLIARTAGESDPAVLLGAALTMRALRAGSVCLPIRQVHRLAQFFDRDADAQAGVAPRLDALPWPAADQWLGALAASALVGGEHAEANERPLRLVDGALYLERHWQDQESITTTLLGRCGPFPGVDVPVLERSLARGSARGDRLDAAQHRAVRTAICARTTVICGGPGTGKTTTISRVVAALRDQAQATGSPVRIALAAPTGKAAARLSESLGEHADELAGQVPAATTLHRLLGIRPDRAPRHGPGHRLPFDMVIVDEMSMVSLPLMARLLEALGPDTRLVMVGDPDQLTPVDAGAVLADITAAGLPGPAPGQPGVVVLDRGYRFTSGISELAQAIRDGDPDRTLELLAGTDAVEFHDQDAAGLDLEATLSLRGELVEQAHATTQAAREGRAGAATAALGAHRLLCAHRTGPYGVTTWGAAAERVQRAAAGQLASGQWYIGRPLLATRNLSELGISNGDTGVVIETAQGLRAAMSNHRSYPAYVLEGVETMYAMTVHKSQGSQFERITLVLPSPDSPLLTRSLLYTAVTRAKTGVRIIGPAASVRSAVVTEAQRASGLTERLSRAPGWPGS
ncbi:exodeoxyribonuclease V subunit alpha [Propionibacterium australiense]|uniref:RecBCD enzyme subunit RecD n=1 Tax=Propionibacterium australiense TaxID=119981 RepID=A0A383S355_9ACTN|nr:exodeoxyribonuclease V subunit alpha [Propionibacterium australiense]RLP11696.1 exodeoxyribonuclease V subunit alpha [Propionibacterium australiense]SYZ32435.1 exodeoxyribonuclease V [Propionibacterium australiense]VEH90215.1 Exodeoxyribonuclease V alpha chain [Propionibacterium australiense]